MDTLSASREELDRQKKILAKRKPTSAENARKRGGGGAQLNGGEFVRPEDPGRLSGQEYYEADEIIKVRAVEWWSGVVGSVEYEGCGGCGFDSRLMRIMAPCRKPAEVPSV